MNEKLFVKIESDNERDVDNLTDDLMNHIKSLQINESTLKRNKEDSRTQDMGAILAIVLGSSSLTLLARGIADWLGKNPSAKISVTEENGKLSMDAEGVTSKDAIKLTEAFRKLQNQK